MNRIDFDDVAGWTVLGVGALCGCGLAAVLFAFAYRLVVNA